MFYSEIDITEVISDLMGKGWQTIKIDLTCFPQSTTSFGISPVPPEEFFATVYEPSKLITSGQLDLTFADVLLQKQAVDNATIKCE